MSSRTAAVVSLCLCACGEAPSISAAALDRAVERSEARGGFVLVADARTGRLLASAYRGMTELPRQIDPASLLKPLAVGIAVQQGVGAFDVPNPCGLTPAQTIARSDNRCAQELTQRIDPAAVAQGLSRFGVTLTPSAPGKEESWAGPAGGCVNPMDLLQAYVAIANGSAPSPETARGLRQAMISAVNEGTAKSARSTRFATAGKTGTSLGTSEQCATGQRVSLFAGFAPADDPQLVVLTAIVEPKGELPLGARHAAPLFKDVVEQMVP